jgi:hypothetical protein
MSAKRQTPVKPGDDVTSARQPRGEGDADHLSTANRTRMITTSWWDEREREQVAAVTKMITDLLTIAPPQPDDAAAAAYEAAAAAYEGVVTDEHVRFLKPTDEELILRKIERLLKTPAQRRNLRRSKWPHYKVVDEEMRIRRGKLKQLPNGEKKEALKEARKRIYEAEGKEFNTHTIRKTYYEVRALLRKAQTSP